MRTLDILLLLTLAAALLWLIFKLRPAYFVGRGNAEMLKGNEEKAAAYFAKAAREPYAKPQHKHSYAFILMKSGKAAEAERLLRAELARTKPGTLVRMQTETHLATAMWLTGQREEAVEILAKLNEKYKNSTIYGNLGYFRLLLGQNLEETLEYNKEAYAYNDSDTTILDNLAQNYYLLGRYEEAAEWYAKVMERKPKYAESYYYYARTLLTLGRIEEAKEHARLAGEKPLAMVTGLDRAAIDALQVDIEKAAR